MRNRVLISKYNNSNGKLFDAFKQKFNKYLDN